VYFAFEVFDGYGLLGFGGEFHCKGAGIFFDDCKAGSVDGDGVADFGFVVAFEC